MGPQCPCVWNPLAPWVTLAAHWEIKMPHGETNTIPINLTSTSSSCDQDIITCTMYLLACTHWHGGKSSPWWWFLSPSSRLLWLFLILLYLSLVLLVHIVLDSWLPSLHNTCRYMTWEWLVCVPFVHLSIYSSEAATVARYMISFMVPSIMTRKVTIKALITIEQTMNAQEFAP